MDAMDVDAGAAAAVAGATAPPATSTDASPAAHLYVVTAHKPSAVGHALVGAFTGPQDVNLIISRNTRVEVHRLTADGLQGVLDVPIYGRIAVMRLLRPAGEATDLLFLATERHTFCVLGFDPASGELVTRSNGDVADRVGRPADTGTLGGVDPGCRAIGLHMYDGLFKVIPVDPRSGALAEAFNIRLEELGLADLAWLDGGRRPTVALLHDAPGAPGGGGSAPGGRAVTTYEVSLKDKDFVAGPWRLEAVDPAASVLAPLPAPLGGCLVLGGSAITYAGGGGGAGPPVTLAVSPRTVRAVARVDDDGSRWLVGDAAGGLSLLALSHDGRAVTGLRLERLGPIPAPSALAYLDNGVVYVGSAWADAQLVRLCADPVQGGGGGGPESYLQVLESFPNVGPIVDMAALDADGGGGGSAAPGGPDDGGSIPPAAPVSGGGACQLVTASGVAQDGSLRVIRNGVGVAEVAAADLPGVTRLWGLRGDGSSPHDSLLLLSFVASSLLLGLDDDGALGEAEPVGDLDTDAPTLAAAADAAGRLLQATPRGVRCLAPGSRALLGSWTPGTPGVTIAAAAANAAQVLVATSDGSLTLLARDGGTGALAVAGGPTPAPGGAEVACLDVTPLGWPEPGAADGPGSGLALVGGWDVALRVVALPSLAVLAASPLGGDAIPRSALALRMEGLDYAFISLGDGRLASFRMAVSGSGVGPGGVAGVDLADRRCVSLGRRPAALAPFVAGGRACALAAGDRPAVAHSANRKLLFSNVNEGDATAMARFNAAAFPDALAVARAPAGGGGGGRGGGDPGAATTTAAEGSLAIGTVDAVQRLHVRCVPLGEQPRRIAHQPETRTLAVTVDGGGGGGGSGAGAGGAPPAAPAPDAVRLFDDGGFAPLDRLALDPSEVACSLTSVTFAGDPTPYYAVGTAVALPDEAEPTKGRILVLAAAPAGGEDGGGGGRPGDGGGSSARRLEVVASREVKGAVYALVPFRGGLLAGINSRVSLYKWAAPGGGEGGEGEGGEGDGGPTAADLALGPSSGAPGGAPPSAPTPVAPPRPAGGPPSRALAHVCSHSGHVLALYLATAGDFVGVGDLMRSIQVLAYNPATRSLEPRARDYHSNWMTAVAALGPGDDAFIGAENSYNLFTVRRNAESAGDEDRARLDVAAEWHLGDFVNRFVRGSLVMRPPDAVGGGGGGGGGDGGDGASQPPGGPLIAGPTLLFGTIGGSVGVIAPLTPSRFAWFDRLQDCMRRAVRGVGGLDHAGWRAFANERGAAPARGVIDGDLVEQFLELPAGVAAGVAAEFGRGETVESIAKAVDDLSRACH